MAKEDKMKFMIAAGGTGGHVYPGIAIAEELKRRAPNADIVFAGTGRGLEAKILPPLGWRVRFIKSASIKDRFGVRRLLAYARIPISVMRAACLLMKEKPSLLVSVGGYAAGPLSIA
ncbi:MAG TPA: glycosyltransferase, partial [bacterium]|nr:glycosyltransferase [bacterium]